MSPSHTERLAARVRAIVSGPLPLEVVDAGKACLLHALVMACAAREDREPVRGLLARAAAPEGNADLLVSGSRAPAAAAAAANAALCASRGQNDTHPALAGHVGCVVVPAVLAAAQAHGAGGGDLLRGLIAGYDVMVALAGGLADLARKRGLRTTSLLGPAGAAAAVAAVLQLDEIATANAIAFGLDAGSGTLQCWGEGSAEWRWQAARSAADGVTAASLALAGARAARFALEGDSGFAAAHVAASVPAPDVEPAWHVLDVELKAFPGCYINQAAAAALIGWLKSRRAALPSIERVEVLLNPADARYPGVARHGPFDDPSSSVMSLPFMLAAALRDHAIRASHFAKEYGPGPLHDLSRCVVVVEHDETAPYDATVRLRFASGAIETVESVRVPRASTGLTAAVARLAPVAAEWTWEDSRRRFDDLVAAVGVLEQVSLDPLLRPCLP